jgi:hypothetical protein
MGASEIMKRRNFVIGLGAASVGGSALLGSGAFTRVESQRSVTVQIAEDPNAYLGMDKCPESPNASYAWLDDNGHLEVLMNPENPTVGESPLGEGVNSDSTSWFDSVFQVCNQGKQDACLWIQDSEDWPRVPDDEAQFGEAAGERRVDFYLNGDDEVSLIGRDNAILLPLGECICVGIKTRTYGLSDGAELLSVLDNEITITADVTEVGPGGTSLGAAPAQGGDPLAVEQVSTQSLGITDLTDPGLGPVDLAEALIAQGGGSGIEVVNGSVSFVGEDTQAGTFDGGTGIIGFEDGILLSSGKVGDVVGPNDSPSTTTNHGNPGDPDLDDLVGGGTNGGTLDAATLEFDFTVPEGTQTVGFNYVFGSEEYNEFVGSEFNDVFGFFLNGDNVAVVDDPDGPGTIPAAINNINEGQPGVPPTNPDLYINNDPFNPNNDGDTVPPGDLLDTEMDGLTVILDIEDEVNDGPNETNTLKIGVADTADRILDSWVLLEAGSFETDPDPEPEPSPCDAV